MMRSERLHRKKVKAEPVFLSWVKEAIQDRHQYRPESAKGRTLLAMHFTTELLQVSGEKEITPPRSRGPMGHQALSAL